MTSRAKPSSYHTIPFHAVRGISILSSIIIAGILGYFCKQLVTDGFKVPWTFIIVLAAALLNLAAILVTSIIACCATLSPIINILLNIPILFLWIFGISILTWNMYGALGHTCNLTNWGNDRGVMVCHIYKTLYSFVVFANLAHIAQLVLDVRARHRQLRRGKYDKMRDSQDIKIDDLKPLNPTVHDTPLSSETSLQQQLRDDRQHQQQSQREPEFRDEVPGWRPGQRPTPSHSYTSQSSSHNYRNNDHYGYDSSTSLQMQDFTHQRSHQPTNYDADNYNVGGYGYQQQNPYYHGRY